MGRQLRRWGWQAVVVREVGGVGGLAKEFLGAARKMESAGA